MFKKLFAFMAAGSLLVGGAAQAGPVVTTGSLSLSIQGLAPIAIPTSGTITVTGSSTIVPAGYVNLPATLTIPVTATTAISQLKVTKLGNLTGTFRSGGALVDFPGETCPVSASNACVTGGGVGGTMPLTGTIFVSVVPTLVVIPVNLNSAGIGQGGSATAGGGQFFFEAAPWTTGIGQVVVPGTPGSTVNITGSNSNTNGGPITLVTPQYVSALGNLLPIFTVLTLSSGAHSVPEPGSLLLIGTGIAGLALLGRRRK
jgi:hypothetical protein